MTVPNTGRVSDTYWLIYITVWVLVMRKVFYFNDLIAIRFDCSENRRFNFFFVAVVVFLRLVFEYCVGENCYCYFYCYCYCYCYCYFPWFDSYLNAFAIK